MADFGTEVHQIDVSNEGRWATVISLASHDLLVTMQPLLMLWSNVTSPRLCSGSPDPKQH